MNYFTFFVSTPVINNESSYMGSLNITVSHFACMMDKAIFLLMHALFLYPCQ